MPGIQGSEDETQNPLAAPGAQDVEQGRADDVWSDAFDGPEYDVAAVTIQRIQRGREARGLAHSAAMTRNAAYEQNVIQTGQAKYKLLPGETEGQHADRLAAALYERTGKLDILKREIWLTNNVSRKERKKAMKSRKKRRKMADDDTHFVHSSNNTLGWLEDEEATKLALIPRDEHPRIRMAWAMVFLLPVDKKKNKKHHPASTNGEQHHARRRPISHETWMVCEQLFACKLILQHHVTPDGKSLIVQIGASLNVLVEEAHISRISIRLQETKGILPFHRDLLEFYATNHGGLNEWDTDQRKFEPRIPERYEHWQKNLPPPILDSKPSGDFGEDKGTWREETPKETRDRHERLFTSAMTQKLVKGRMRRLGRIVPDKIIGLPKPSQAVGFVIKHCIMNRRPVEARRLDDLLAAHGGYRPLADLVFPTVDGVAVVRKLAEACLRDPIFILDPKVGCRSHSLEKDAVTYDLVTDVCFVLDAWRHGVDGPGRNEQFVHTFHSFFPLHDERELAYLGTEWGSFKLLTRCKTLGYQAEGEARKVMDEVHDAGQENFEFNTMGSDRNKPREHTLPWAWYYQPIEEIRDYFGGLHPPPTQHNTHTHTHTHTISKTAHSTQSFSSQVL